MTQFGGNYVYWGFTGSTGTFFAENLIAITSIPNSLTSSATLQNLTKGETAGSDKITADYNDQIKVEDTIRTDHNATEVDGYDVDLVYPLPAGLTYEPGSFQMNGATVGAENLTISENEIRFRTHFLNDMTYKVNFNTHVTSRNTEELTTRFLVNDLAGNELSESNEVSITMSGTPRVVSSTVVNAVDIDSVNADGTYKQILEFGKIEENVFEYGDTININQNPIVTNGKNTMTSNGWTFQGTTQQVLNGVTTNISDTNVVTSADGTTVNYLYKTEKGTIVAKFENSKGQTIADDVTEKVLLFDGPVNLATNQEVIDTLSKLKESNYEIVSRPSNETSIQPIVDETIEVTYVLRQVNYSLSGLDFTIALNEVKGKTASELSEIVMKNSKPTAFKVIDEDKTELTKAIVVTNFGGLDREDVASGEIYTVLLTVRASDSGLAYDISNSIKVSVESDKSVIVDPDDGETPFNPTDPSTQEPVAPNPSSDLLKIQYVSDFNFGINKRNLFSDDHLLSDGDYGKADDGELKNVPAFVSISDERSDSTGWQLSVSAKEFVSKADNKSVLSGAYLTLSDGKYNGNTSEKPEVVDSQIEVSEDPTLVSTSKAGLNGSWSLALGDLDTKGKSSGVNLTVPKNAVRNLGEYVTNIVWTLTPQIN